VRTWRALTAIGVLAVMAAAGAAAAGCGDDGPSSGEQRADQARQAALDAGLTDEAAEVVALAAGSVDATYRVVYEIPAADGGPPGRTAVVQRPPDRRVDIVELNGDIESTILRDGVTHQCRHTSGTWECEQLGRPPTGGVFDEDAVDAAVDAIVAQAEDFDLIVESREVLGVPVQCLVARGRETTAVGELCVSEEGAIMSLQSVGGTLTAVQYATEVGDDEFELPAAG
jgi:hypothetical protein